MLKKLLLVLAVLSFVAAACGDDDDGGDSAEATTSAAEGDTTDDTPKEGPVTIANQVDFNSRPVAGKFEVTEGADILECSSGTFVQAGTPTEGVQRVYTCDSGSNEGSFTADLSFLAEANTVSDSGTWTILEGSDDFVDLQGDGDWSIVLATDDSDIGVGTWTGDISYTSDDGGDSAEATPSAAEDDTTTGGTPKEGSVTIANQVDFNFRPVTGTFEVTEGADILGCSSGTFVDAGTPTEGIQRVYTCDSGSNEGSFTASSNFATQANTLSDNGTWSISEGSDDFVGLQGEGDWSIVYATDDSDIGEGTWTGDITYTS